MARPRKQGLEYFTKNVNFYQDLKIRKMIRHKGIQAVSVYDILLCQIYAVGYYLEWDDDLPFVISEVSNLQENTVLDVINYALSIGLFDQTMFDSHKVLTSYGIQERYFNICSVAKRKISNDIPYLLQEPPQNSVTSDKKEVSEIKTFISPEETAVISEETLIKSAKSTQRKEKKRKDNLPSGDYQRLRTRETAGISVSQSDEKVFSDVDEEVSDLLNQNAWKNAVFERFTFLQGNEEFLEGFLLRWAQEVKISSKQHINLGDAKNHFAKWMIIQEEKFIKTKNNGKENNNGYRTDEDIIRGAINIYKELRAENPEPSKTLPVA